MKILLQRKRTHTGKLTGPLSVFVFITILSVAASANVSVSLLKLSATTPLFLLYFLLDSSARNKALKFLAFTVIAVCVIGIAQKISFGAAVSSNPFSGRIYSTLGNPNFLSSFLLISFPFFAAWTDKRNLGYLTILPYICILLTQTAGSILSLLVILGLFFVRGGKKKRLSLPGILFPIHLIIILCVLIAGGSSSKTMSAKKRFFKWRAGLQIVKTRPLLGTGWGGVKTNFALYQNSIKRDFNLKSTSESKIHNDYIQIMAESGITGFISFGALLLSALVILRKKNFYAFAALTAFMLDSVTNFPVELPSSLIFFALILSFDGAKHTAKMLPATKKSTLLQIAITLICLFFLLISVRDFASDISRKQGYDSYAAGDLKKAERAWLRAHLLSPTSGKTAYALGMLYINDKRYNEAVRMFRESIKIRNYGEVYNNLGNALYLSNRPEEALAAWQKAVTLGCPGRKNIQKNINLLKKTPN
ncbi:MAG: O-antigen ligase family protein [Elusimicrobiota bacterium]|nr:O-antigen ligase family protein [Elusimicrobiota bacterium]